MIMALCEQDTFLYLHSVTKYYLNTLFGVSIVGVQYDLTRTMSQQLRSYYP